jgi:hypothetical protein
VKEYQPRWNNTIPALRTRIALSTPYPYLPALVNPKMEKMGKLLNSFFLDKITSGAYKTGGGKR